MRGCHLLFLNINKHDTWRNICDPVLRHIQLLMLGMTLLHAEPVLCPLCALPAMAVMSLCLHQWTFGYLQIFAATCMNWVSLGWMSMKKEACRRKANFKRNYFLVPRRNVYIPTVGIAFLLNNSTGFLALELIRPWLCLVVKNTVSHSVDCVNTVRI